MKYCSNLVSVVWLSNTFDGILLVLLISNCEMVYFILPNGLLLPFSSLLSVQMGTQRVSLDETETAIPWNLRTLNFMNSNVCSKETIYGVNLPIGETATCNSTYTYAYYGWSVAVDSAIIARSHHSSSYHFTISSLMKTTVLLHTLCNSNSGRNQRLCWIRSRYLHVRNACIYDCMCQQHMIKQNG